MGLIGSLFAAFFGGGQNVVRETAEVFRENAEAKGAREAAYQQAALAQFAEEFAYARQGWFDRFIDALNRVPRPAMAVGTLFLLASAMIDPVWFGSRMEGLALVPEPLWWLLGAIVSFYFGARAQQKGQEFQRSIAETMARSASFAQFMSRSPTEDLETEAPSHSAGIQASNPALEAWRDGRD